MTRAAVVTADARSCKESGVAPKYGIPVADLPAHCLDAVDVAERSRARTLVVRDGQPLAAIVPMADLDKIDPPDPAADGVDPLLALCGTCRHDDFVDSLFIDFTRTGLWHRG
jgi:hypothetical protein